MLSKCFARVYFRADFLKLRRLRVVSIELKHIFIAFYLQIILLARPFMCIYRRRERERNRKRAVRYREQSAIDVFLKTH